tara:strand:- start:4981 stop:5253 length:273 start_codon:yes stop_codon:yes gene_type:complete
MVPIFISKRIITWGLKKIMERRQMKRIRDYVEEVNEVDIQLKQLQKNVEKQGKYIEDLEKDNAILKKDSHPSQEYICCKKCGCKITKIKK